MNTKRFNIYYILKRIPILCLSMISYSLIGQSGSGITGGKASSDEFKVSFSVGQVFYTAISNENYYISHGLQHPLLKVSTDLSNIETGDLKINVFPNPTTNKIHILIKNTEYDDLNFQLFDMQGKILKREQIETNEIEIPFSTYNPGAYIIRIYEGHKMLNYFKIIKTN